MSKKPLTPEEIKAQVAELMKKNAPVKAAENVTIVHGLPRGRIGQMIDVKVAGVTDGQGLAYNAEHDWWQPANFSLVGHTHDDRYYTESEINTILLDYYTSSEVDTLLLDYALLPGRNGGQTLKGGTAVGDDLILQTTAGAGDGTDQIVFKGGNDGANEIARFRKDPICGTELYGLSLGDVAAGDYAPLLCVNFNHTGADPDSWVSVNGVYSILNPSADYGAGFSGIEVSSNTGVGNAHNFTTLDNAIFSMTHRGVGEVDTMIGADCSANTRPDTGRVYTMYGLIAGGFNWGSPVDVMVGAELSVRAAKLGTASVAISDMIAAHVKFGLSDGSITRAVALKVNPVDPYWNSSNIYGGTIGNATMVEIGDWDTGPTYTNPPVQLKLLAATPAGAIGIYQDGTGAYNKYEGKSMLGADAQPTALAHLGAGTTAAGSAPLKLTSGTSMTTAEAGAVEYTTDDLFFTVATGVARKRLLMADPVGGLTSGRVPFATTNGRLTDDPDLTFSGDTLTATKVSTDTIYVNDNLVASRTAGEGIKVDPASPAFPWHDIIGNVSIRGTGGADPAYNTYQGNYRAHFFAVNDEVFMEFHIPHDYVPGTDLYIHTHWSQAAKTKAGAASGTVTGGTVTWGFELTYAKGHQQAAFPATLTQSVNPACNTTTFWHHISEVAFTNNGGDGTHLDRNIIEVDGIILMRVYLSANGITVSSGAAPAPVLHFADIHYQSTGIGTKQKAPDFYAA